MNIAEEIRAQMGRAKLNYPQLAKKAGLTEATIYRKLKHEKSILDLPQIEKIAAALGLPASELMRRAEENQEKEKE